VTDPQSDAGMETCMMQAQCNVTHAERLGIYITEVLCPVAGEGRKILQGI
jgi:hypothetical protein